jgi:hypothetical protein
MFFAHSEAAWAKKLGTSWFSTHPPLEERVRAIDNRVSEVKFKLLVGDERRKIAARAKQAVAEEAATEGAKPASGAPGAAAANASATAASPPLESLDMTGSMPVMAAVPTGQRDIASTGNIPALRTGQKRASPDSLALVETLPSGVRLVAGRAAPPDELRQRLSQEQQAAIVDFVANVEQTPSVVPAVFVATMLAAEPAKARVQLTKLAPLLGIEWMKATQAMAGKVAALAPAVRLPMLTDLFVLLDKLEAADRKKLRLVARAFAPAVSRGDMLRFAVTRLLEKKLAKAAEPAPPVPLPDRAPALCEIYVALAQCRFGAGTQGQGAYRAGLMGLLPPQKWSPFPESLLTIAQLDAALAALAQVHPTGKRSFAEGMTRVIAVGGQLTASQLDLLRATCQLIDCPVPALPADLAFEDGESGQPAAQLSAR